MLEWGKPTGSIIVVYLTVYEDNVAVVWACLPSGYLPWLQPVLEKGHVMYITKLFGSATWLTSELGAEQITSISADWVAHEAKPDDAILFLTSGSTGFLKAHAPDHPCYMPWPGEKLRPDF
ncbi:hypothetical protein BDR06DRAFT_976461 [Suillus hirtellus]|nr:hypothetical protein BDR06DRAFT_976461 [Suillus hirtellus]